MVVHYSIWFRIFSILIPSLCILSINALAQTDEQYIQDLTDQPKCLVISPVCEKNLPLVNPYKINAAEIINLYTSNIFHRKNTALSSFPQHTDNRNFDYGKLHKYLGYTTILLTGIAAASRSDKSFHYASAYTATSMGLATCYTGYIEHNDRFNLDGGLLSEDNLHILLGSLGTIGLVTSVAIADSGKESSHGGIGGAGGVTMLVSVFVIKW